MPSRQSPLVALALAVLTTACVGGSGDDATREALVAELREAVEGDAAVDLDAVVGGTWTQLVFVCPYEDERDVEDRLGFPWEDFPGPDQSEGRATFVFASGDDVTTWTTIGRSLGDPCGSSTVPRSVPRASASFSVEQTDNTADGKPFYSLVQRRSTTSYCGSYESLGTRTTVPSPPCSSSRR